MYDCQLIIDTHRSTLTQVIGSGHRLIQPLMIRIVSVADPGFPVGGAHLVEGAPTPDVDTFHKICMSKGKIRDPWGRRVRPLGSATESGQFIWTLD